MKLVPRILIQTCCSPIGLAKKLIQDFFFPYDVSSSSYLSLTSFKTILLDCIVTAVLSVCIKEKLIKIGEFLCSHFNIEHGRRYATFSVYYTLLFQER